MRVTWLASYPKSGNTWARFLLYQYFHGEAASSDQVASVIPDLQIKGQVEAAARGKDELMIKSHEMYRAGTRGERYIYLVRHPRDVILSCLSFMHMQSKGSLNKNVSDEHFVRLFLRLGTDPLYAPFGTIEQNWKSWLTQTAMPGIVVRYEDLKTDAPREFRRMIDALGAPFDEARARRAVELSSFDRMKALEVREKSAGKESPVFFGSGQKLRQGLRFMNKGQSGRSLEPIAKGLDAECDARFAETLERFGYAAR